MSEGVKQEAPAESGHVPFSRTLHTLEKMDNVAHVLVAGFFIVMATTVLIYSLAIFAQQIPLIGSAFHGNVGQAAAVSTAERETASGATAEKSHGAEVALPSGRNTPAAEAREPREVKAGADPFFRYSLELLSSVLFVVIVLELLKTIITYLQTRDIYAIMKEFLVVGIISSVRKILLVGAESSLAGDSGWEFIKEASGTVISIIGILLLIYGLVLLQRTHTDTKGQVAAPP